MSDMIPNSASSSIIINGDGTSQNFMGEPIPNPNYSTPAPDCRWEGQLVVLAYDESDVSVGVSVRYQIHGMRQSGTVSILSTAAIGTTHFSAGWSITFPVDATQFAAEITVPNAVTADVDWHFDYKYQGPT